MRRVFCNREKSPCALLKKLSGSDTMTSTVTKYQQLADSFKLLSVFFYEPEMHLWEQEDILNQFSLLLQKIGRASCREIVSSPV